MSSIGSVLKEARTKKAVSLEDVHSKIKIHPRVLQLLEEDKFDKLPSPMFAKNFLKSYADFLEVNTDSLIEIYEKQRKSEPDQVLFIRPADPRASHKPMLSIPPQKIAGFIVLLAAVVLFMSGIPQRAIGAWAIKMKPAKTAKAKAVEKEKKEEKATAKQEPDEDKGSSEWLNSVKLGNFPQIAKKTALDLEIRATDAVWVHITGDGVVLYQGILKKGASSSWNAKQTIEVWTGNAANMTLSLNKTPLGSPGKGVVKKMLISHEGIRMASPINS